MYENLGSFLCCFTIAIMIFKIPANFISTNYNLYFAFLWILVKSNIVSCILAIYIFCFGASMFMSFVHFLTTECVLMFLRAFYRLCVCVSCSVVSNSLWPPWTIAHQAPLFMASPGRNAGVGCHFLLQGIVLTQGSNLGLLHCRQILYHLSHQGNSIIDYAY